MKIRQPKKTPEVLLSQVEAGDVFWYDVPGHVKKLFVKVTNTGGLRNAMDVSLGGLWFIPEDSLCTPVDAELVIK